MGDKIGVLLEFNNEDNTCNLSYYRNGSFIGKAFENMPPAQYYPAVSIMHGDAQVTLNPNVKIPLGAYKMDNNRGGGEEEE